MTIRLNSSRKSPRKSWGSKFGSLSYLKKEETAIKKKAAENKLTKPQKATKPGSTEAHQALVREILWRLVGRAAVWSQSTGAAKIGDRFIRFGRPGSPDITGVLQGGYRLDIEVKTGNAKQSESQREYQKEVESFGGLYIVARDAGDVLAQIDRFLETRANKSKPI